MLKKKRTKSTNKVLIGISILFIIISFSLLILWHQINKNNSKDNTELVAEKSQLEDNNTPK